MPGPGLKVLAVTAMHSAQATQSVHALLTVQAKMAGMAA